MKVLYDFDAFTYQKIGGVSKCFCELIKHFDKSVDYKIAITQSDNIHLIESQLVDNLSKISFDYDKFLPNLQFKGKYNLYHWLCRNYPSKFPSADAINMRFSIEEIKRGDFDVFHPTGFKTYYLDYLTDKPFVYTIHDMTPALFGSSNTGLRNLAKSIATSAQRANHIIAVSENTKKDIVRLLSIPEDRITVIHHGGPAIENLIEVPLVSEPYFLYVGNRSGYKNFIIVLSAFAEFRKSHHGYKLVCTGASFSEEEHKLLKSLDLSDSTIHIRATNSQLKNLYANAVSFIYPSLYEGFGMPILEAFALGCPVILNKKSCFPEIAGEAGMYFNSDIGYSGLLNQMENVVSMSPNERELQCCLGRKRLEQFSWHTASSKLTEVYNRVI